MLCFALLCSALLCFALRCSALLCCALFHFNLLYFDRLLTYLLARSLAVLATRALCILHASVMHPRASVWNRVLLYKCECIGIAICDGCCARETSTLYSKILKVLNLATDLVYMKLV